MKACFDEISDLNFFFLRLQALTGTDLSPHESVIIFDEVQLFPKARQAIKHLVKDGRYHYIETGSLISIKKNVKDILIPSEEMKIQVFPMDYEEFCDAHGVNYKILESVFDSRKALGPQVGRKLMRDLRIYMAVGGMPQAVEAYVEGKTLQLLIVSNVKLLRCTKKISIKLIRQEEYLLCIIPFQRNCQRMESGT